MTLFQLATANARDEFARTIPSPLREIAEAERRTHYAVQRKSDAWWWMFDGLFHPNRDFARRFACASVAKRQAEVECLADPRDWTVEPVEGV